MNIEKEKRAIKYLKSFQPSNEPYFLCYSGGKDSDVILALSKLAGINYEAVHNLTTVDAPETIRYIRSQPEIQIEHPPKTMWQLIVEKKMPPTRIVRYCCEKLKERGGKGRVKITGVRWAESHNRNTNSGLIAVIGKPATNAKLAEKTGAVYHVNRKKGLVLNTDNDESRRFVELCYRTTSTLVNPIIDWTDQDVWAFLHHYGIRPNPLYEVKDVGSTYMCCGTRRIGCIGCPMQGSSGMKMDFIRYPKYRDIYLRTFERMQKHRIETGMAPFGSDRYGGMSPRQIMMWWVGDDPRQLSIFGEPEYLKGSCL